MDSKDQKPGSGRFASGNKFKGRGTTGPFNKDKSFRSFSSDRDNQNSNTDRPAREDRTSKFKSEGKKVYGRSERFNRDDNNARPSGERSRSFDDKKASFKSGSKFSKPAPFKGRRDDTGGERNAERSNFNQDRPERRERSERSSENSSDRPRYGARDNKEGYNANRSSRSEGSRKPYSDKFSTDRGAGDRKPYQDRDSQERKPYGNKSFRNNEPGERKPKFDRADRENKSRENREGTQPESQAGADRPVTKARYEVKFDGDRTSGRTFKPREDGDRSKDRYEKKPFNRSSRPESMGSETRGKRPFDRKRGDEPAEAPNYDLKRFQGRERKTAEKEDDGLIRLNRYIANAGICSRREADNLIASGEIKVNGEVVTEMGYSVRPEDTVTYGKKRLNREKMVYVLLNKPKDFITTTEDPEGRKTVMDLVGKASKERIFPVGRLDRNTTGLLLFTNDGELAQKLTHPSNNISKIYQVELDKPITRDHFEMITNGLELEDGKAMVDDLALIGNGNTFLGIQIHIGKNRIVRRIFEHLGYDVIALDRVQYAGLTKKDLPRGNWRFLNEKEVIRLKYFL